MSQTDPEHKREYEREYSKRHRERDSERRSETVRRWKQANPEKKAAQRAIECAVRYGRLVSEPCLFCDRPKVHAHHHDYTQPLAVTWLCARHHALAHRSLV